MPVMREEFRRIGGFANAVRFWGEVNPELCSRGLGQPSLNDPIRSGRRGNRPLTGGVNRCATVAF